MTEQELIEQAIANGTDLPGRTGQADTQHTFYESNGQPYFKKVGGGKQYIPPASAMSMFDDPKALAWAKSQGYEIKGGAQGLEDASRGIVGPDGKTTYAPSPVTMPSQSGGLWHTTGTWNSETGKMDSSFDWGNLFTMVVAGVVTAGAASAIMAAAGVPEVVSDAAITAAQTSGADAGAAVLTGGGAGAVAGGTATVVPAGILAPTTAALPAITAGEVATTAAVGGAAGATLGSIIPQSSASLSGPTSSTVPISGMGGGSPVLAPATETALNTIGPAASKASLFGGLSGLATTNSLVGAGTTLLGAYLQSRAAGNAAEASAAAQDKQLAYLREVEAAQENEFYSSQQQNQQQFASTQQLNLDQYNRRAANLDPYVQIGHNANATLNSMMGFGAFSPYQPVALKAPGPYGAPATQSAQAAPSGSNTNWEAAFQKLTGGQAMDDASLKALAQTPAFKAAGFTLTPNNQLGFSTKVGTPDGNWFRVLDGDPTQKNSTVFVQQPNAAGGSSGGGNAPTLQNLMSQFGTTIPTGSSVTAPAAVLSPSLASLYSSQFTSPNVYA